MEGERSSIQGVIKGKKPLPTLPHSKHISQTFYPVLPGQNKMSSRYVRIRGGNGDFNSAQTSFHSLFWTFYSVLVIFSKVQHCARLSTQYLNANIIQVYPCTMADHVLHMCLSPFLPLGQLTEHFW